MRILTTTHPASFGHATPGNQSPRRSRFFASSGVFFLLLSAIAASLLASPALAAPAPVPLRPYSYASISSNTTYDLFVADGVNKDRRVARVKVDSVFFGNVSAKLSTNGSAAAFRVSGDRLGGSSIYSVDVQSGKYKAIASSKNSSEGIGTFAWSPAGNTMAYTRGGPMPDPDRADELFGTIYVYSVGFQAAKLQGSAGSDRLLGFAGNGLGVYAVRREQGPSGPLDHLVYITLDGGQVRTIAHSQPNFKLSSFSLWAPPGAPAKIAYLAEGTYGGVAGAQGGRLTAPNGLGLIVSDEMGSLPTLLRRDMEAFPLLAWTPGGTGLVAGGSRSGAAWAVDLGGNKRPVTTPLANLDVASQSVDGKMLVLTDAPTTRVVTLNVESGGLFAQRYVGVTPKAGAAAVRLKVPYVHQVKDTAGNGDGNWACGPTSVAMALAYFSKIDPWPAGVAGDHLVGAPLAGAITNTLVLTNTGKPAPTATPRPLTGADFGLYVTNKYTAYGHTYGSVARDPQGHMLAGLYGTISQGGLASWNMISQVLAWHGLRGQYVGVSWDGIVGALRRGHPVLLGNLLTSEGHIVLVVGYTADGNLIVHDPYGNRLKPGYGMNDGNAVYYPWKMMTPRTAMEVVGAGPAR